MAEQKFLEWKFVLSVQQGGSERFLRTLGEHPEHFQRDDQSEPMVSRLLPREHESSFFARLRSGKLLG